MTRKRKHEELDPEIGPELDPEVVPAAPEEAEPAAAGDEPAETDTAEEEGALAQEFEGLAVALDQKAKEAQEANEKYLRIYADFENYRKRMQREQSEFRKYANEQMALELLTVLDHLGLALKHAGEAGGGGEGLQQGVELVHKQFRDVLEKFGIKTFKAEGEPFDPAVHDAMMQVESADVPENTVVQVFQDGYLYHEKVLRHAKVGVSKKPSGAPAPAADQPAAEAAPADDGETED